MRSRFGNDRNSSVDDGFTLVEMLVALFIVSGSLLALLAGFTTSAMSQRGQEARAGAVRVAMAHNDKLRNADYATVSSSTDVNVVYNGRTFRRITTVSTVDSRPGSSEPGDTIKRVSTKVEWSIGSVTRSVTLETAVAPTSTATSALAAQNVTSMSVSPTAVAVDAAGATTSSVVVRVAMTGYPTSERPTISWNDDSGSRSVLADSTDASNWIVTLPTSTIRKVVLAGGSTSLDFTVKTSSNQTSAAALTIQGPSTQPAPTLSCSVNPTTIPVNGAGKNSGAVTVSCTVGGLDTTLNPTLDRVALDYQGANGVTTSTSLVRNTTTPTVWSDTFSPRSATFARGSKFFVFTVTRNAGGLASRSVAVTVS